jgi:hypothetical protein
MKIVGVRSQRGFWKIGTGLKGGLGRGKRGELIVRFFSNRLLLYFSEWKFGLEFVDPCGIQKIRDITGEKLRNLANSRSHG